MTARIALELDVVRQRAALDINAHLIAELGAEVPEEYYGGFLTAGSSG